MIRHVNIGPCNGFRGRIARVYYFVFSYDIQCSGFFCTSQSNFSHLSFGETMEKGRQT